MNDFEFGDDIKEPKQIIVKKSTPTGMIIAMIVAVAVAAFFAGAYFSNINSDSITNSDLEDVISRVGLKLGNSQTPSQQISPQPTGPIIVSLDDDPMKGNPDAEITIVEFSDFQCPFCWRFYTQTLPLIEQNYISTGQVNFVYRDFPIQSIHPNAFPAALASECADDQGKFWEMHDMIFLNQKNWQNLQIEQSVSLFKEYAIEIGLTIDEFNSCMTTVKHLEEIQNDLDDGRAYGVTGTPGFFVGNEKIGFTKINGAQPFSVFQRILDNQLGQ